MEKTKLGISVALAAALIYFLGALAGIGNILVVLIAVGYVLIVETNIKLKREAVKALILIITLAAVSFLISWGLSGFQNFMSFLPNRDFIINIRSFINSSVSGINNIVRLIVFIVPIVFGFRAYKQKSTKIKWIDKILDANFDKE